MEAIRQESSAPAHPMPPPAPVLEAPASPALESLTAPPAKKGRGRAFLILGVITAVIIGGIFMHSALTAGQEDTDNAQVDADVVAVAPRIGGAVAHVKVEEDSIVKKGDLLFELDDTDLAARLEQSKAELDTAQAQALAADAQVDVVQASARGGLSTARAQLSGSSVAVGSADAQIATAKAGMQRAQADQHKAELDLNRAKELRAANAVTQERLDNMQAAFDSAQAALAQARAQLEAASEQKRMALSRVDEARGRVDQSTPIDAQIAAIKAQARLAHAKVKSAEVAVSIVALQLSYTKVLAPADGMVSKLTAREGQLLQPGQPVAELVPVTSYVVANFKETQVGQMKKGDRAEIVIDAFPGRKFEGVVTSLSGGTGAQFSLLPPDNASGNFVKVVQRVPVRIAWKTPPEVAMRAGLSADVTVWTRK
jgi:membrane fusion protein (multidrug efflux system)